MSQRQTEGKETWRRLRDWSSDKATSERLSAQILRHEGYTSIDPSHPLGGPDGLKDIVCVKNGKKWIGAAYFPTKHVSLSQIKTKFSDDFIGVSKNHVDGIAFVTNQELTLSEREEVRQLAAGSEVDLYHLERISSILDFPSCYGIRLEYLRIEMNIEEQIAFVHAQGEIANKMEKILQYLKEQETGKEMPREEIFVTPDYTIRQSWVGKIHNCSFCGFGYSVNDVDPSISSKYSAVLFALNGPKIYCPKCGNAEIYNTW